MRSHVIAIFKSLLMAYVMSAFLIAPDASAQTCFDYVDSCSRPGWVIPVPHPSCVNAKAPLRCVQQGPLAATGTLTSCSWDPDCHEDGNPGDCCTSVIASSTQSILEMHTRWHDCFGNIGDQGDINNPPGRGQRWYAFHRQFELDFMLWREPLGYSPIQSLQWCPGMNMPIGHFGGGWPASGVGAHPNGCGTGPNRPGNTACPDCIAFPQCLFQSGAGPALCPSAASSTCGVTGFGGVFLGFPTYTALADFKNVEEVSTVLDHFFHGQMHGAVGIADRGGPTCDPGAGIFTDCYVLDVTDPSCSPRDPMFWRLHKALDDVVRSWQNLKAVDVVLVIDRSGSMSEPDSGGSTKFVAALNAIQNFADLMDTSRADGQINRIGIVSYSSGPATIEMPLTDADSSLLTGPVTNAINTLTATGPGGCTGIGLGIQKALEMLCPPTGNCQGFSGSGDNDRKAILLLTDGVENVPPCLKPAGASGGSCGSQCFGPSLDFNRLEFTQLVSVGFGNTGSLNGDLLTFLSERQGGVYMQNPNTAGYDLKDFFTKAFGQLTSEFIAADPKGLLAPSDAASDIVEYQSCQDGMITFASGWQRDVAKGNLRLQVTTPSLKLVRSGTTSVQESTQRQWAYSRIRFPYLGESSGTWSAQLIRPHLTFVNGFTPDSFAKLSQGVEIVRRQIHRLCPDGCKTVLYFENKRRGDSAYEAALKAEQDSGLVGAVERVRTPVEFNSRLSRQKWDLIVYAGMGDDSPEPYDSRLTELICGRQKAIITDTRARAGASILRCAGAFHDGQNNWPALESNEKLFSGRVDLKNPGHKIFSYGIKSSASVQATAKFQRGTTMAVIARVAPGEAQNWFMNVLATGLSRLSPVREKLSWRTGDDLIATVRILPSDIRSGGYDHVDARVEVEYPTEGLGTLLSRTQIRGADGRTVRGEQLDPRAAALAKINVPTKTATFPLYDDGTHGDLHPQNFYWSARLPGMGLVDGMYKLRFMLDFTVGGCTTRRELVQSIFVDVGVRPKDSGVRIIDIVTQDRTTRTTVRITPADSLGNLLGPGRAGTIQCATPKECDINPKDVIDNGDGSYTVTLVTARSMAGVRLSAFGTSLDLTMPCDDCPKLAAFSLEGTAIKEHSKSTGSVQLTSAAPKTSSGGALVYLSSSQPMVVQVPASVVIPAGQSKATFPVLVTHAHEQPVTVTVEANYGGESRSSMITVMPLARGAAGPPTPRGKFTHPHTPTPSPSPSPSVSLDLSGSPAIGPEDAPIVLVEFTDYQCPYCALVQDTLRQLLEMYEGKIRHVVKNLPLSSHAEADTAAVAALAAGRQGKFWDFRRLLFENQNAMSEADLVRYAKKLNLDLERFEMDRKDPSLRELIARDMKQAAELGTSGTPTFFVNGQRINGAHPLTVFQALVDQVLSKPKAEANTSYGQKTMH